MRLPKKVLLRFVKDQYTKKHGRTFFDKTQNGGVKQDGGF
jgi:hypothetical protein